MFNIFKNNITITAYVNDNYVSLLKTFPISHSAKYLPIGWKDIPAENFNWERFEVEANVKGCLGIIGTIKTGFVLPLWSDLAIEWNDEILKYKFADNMSHCSFHNPSQYPNFYNDYFIIKLNSPWTLNTTENLKILFTNHFYSFNKPEPFIIPYGIIETIHNTTATNIFLFLKKEKETQRIIIPAGTPIIHLIPLTDKKIILKNDAMSNNKNNYNNSMRNTPFIESFVGRGIKTLKHFKK